MGNEAGRDSSGAATTRFALRDVLSLVVLLGAGLVIAVSASLVGITHQLDDEADAITKAVDSVRLGKRMERLISAHFRADHPVSRAAIGRELEEVIDRADRTVVGHAQRLAFDEARQHMSAYLAGGDDARNELERASAAIADLVAVNVAHVGAIHEQIQARNLAAKLLGATGAIIVFFGTVALVIWLRRTAFRPIGRLHRAMAQFSAGDAAARAPVEGPRELAEIAAGFNRMADALDDRRRRQLAFLAGVAHDLRSPLAAMMLSVETLRRRTPSVEQLERTVGILGRQMQRVDRMLLDLVDASQIETGSFDLKLARSDLRAIVRDVVDLFGSSSATHELIVDLPPGPIELECDSARLTQVLGNLVGNAIKYSPDGGRIVVALVESGDELRLSVSDNGIGIPAQDQPQLFEAFRRGRLRTDLPGTGLGLFVVKRLVEAHRGRIELKSAEGMGSTFTVVLPRAAAAPPGLPAPYPAADEVPVGAA
jgi:two-component system, OmpR family, sensor histidine kinase MtrB